MTPEHNPAKQSTRVARWYIFIPKMPIWVYSEGLGTGWCTYFLAIWYNFGEFGNFVVIWYIFHVRVYCTKKNLATLQSPRSFFDILKSFTTKS
jgi:hypothetical protein